MAKKPKRKKGTLKAAPMSEPASGVAVLKMKGPGLLGFLLPVRPDLGLHDVNSTRSNMVRLLADHGPLAESLPAEDRAGPALSCVPEGERAALLLSLATTVCRAEYHERRFHSITQHLAERRRAVAVPISYEAHVSAAVFEGAAALGAARTLVDEMVHIAARRNGQRGWEVSKLIKEGSSKASVPEVRLLRERATWFEALNKYRNVLYHRGWKGEAGAYFPADAVEPEAADPNRNLLLVPDLESLKDDTRADLWTYKDRRHLETIVKAAMDGMRDLVDSVCIEVWQGKIPRAGTIPTEEQPNILVACPRPVPFIGEGRIYLPVFSSQEKAEEFSDYPAGLDLKLASLPLMNTLFPQPAFALSISGLELHVTSGIAITILVDPASMSPPRARVEAPVAPALTGTTPFYDPVGMPKAAVGADQLLCWQQA